MCASGGEWKVERKEKEEGEGGRADEGERNGVGKRRGRYRDAGLLRGDAWMACLFGRPNGHHTH